MSQEFYLATGRRKESSASIRLVPGGSGKIVINNRPFEDYMPRPAHRYSVLQPLELVEARDSVDIVCSVRGGGQTGQAEAIRLGIARALVKYDEDLRSKLKAGGLLTRDARETERKKYGLAGARKRFQYSKR